MIYNLNNFLAQKAIELPKNIKKVFAIFLDIILSVIATWLSISIQLEELVTLNFHYLTPALVSIVIALPLFFIFGLYTVIFRYNSIQSVLTLVKATTIYTVPYLFIFTFISVQGIPRSVGLIQPMILFVLIIFSRWIVKSWLVKSPLIRSNKNYPGILIYGAGRSGRELASTIVNKNELRFVGFIDDNKHFWGRTLDGHLIDSPKSINKLIKTKNAKQIWLALPNILEKKRKKLLKDLKKYPIHVQTLPNFSDLVHGKIRISDIRELNVNELLGRETVKPNNILLKKCIFNKTILVTGAGGSIGSELCRQIIVNKPNSIILIENSELALYNIHQELQKFIKEFDKYNNTFLVPLLVDVRDELKLSHVFETWKPNTVYHSAAYKHVPIVEHNVIAGISNNVLGTISCANIAIKYNVDHFVLISTDKAVRPTNVMGASKRLAELGLQSLSNDTKSSTCFCMVRFGNVLGSSGSVVPLFRKQIKDGGPITLTNKKVTRYFMTIQEAAQLVIQAGSISKGGEVFVLDMGKPIRIMDLAENLIKYEGKLIKNKNTPWGDIEINITGLRPGEKLYEELLISKNAKLTKHPRIHKANEDYLSNKAFNTILEELKSAINQNNISIIKSILIKYVSGYKPSKEIINSQ